MGQGRLRRWALHFLFQGARALVLRPTACRPSCIEVKTKVNKYPSGRTVSNLSSALHYDQKRAVTSAIDVGVSDFQ